MRSPRPTLTRPYPRSARLWLGVVAAAVTLAACSAPAPPARTAPTSPPAGPSASAADQVEAGLSTALAKLPHFPPAPAPVPIPLPSGPSAPIYSRLPITAPVAFLTMDDGYDQLPQDLQLMRAAHVPFTMFAIAPIAAKDPAFFRQLVDYGGVIEDHTMTHPDLRGKPYAAQQTEICGARSLVAGTFGRNPTLFRPPYGSYDATTLRVVHDCGLTAAINWTETVDAGIVRYQTAEHTIKPGDIILMHFRPAFVDDVVAALTAMHDAGLTPALLEYYVTRPPAHEGRA